MIKNSIKTRGMATLIISLVLSLTGCLGGGGSDTPPPPSDTTAPVVTQTTPLNYAIDVQLDTQIVVTFNELINSSTVNNSSFIVKDAMGDIVPGVITESNTSYIFTPDLLLKFDTSYSVTITDTITDLSGNNLENVYSWVFYTIKVPDPRAPATLDVSNLTDSSVTLNGLFTNPSSDTTTVWFEYGLTDTYGSTAPSAAYAAEGTIDYSADLSNLSDKTIYHYRIVTQNNLGVFYGEDKTFRTYISALTLADDLDAPNSLHLYNNELYWVEIYSDAVKKISVNGGAATIEASSAMGGNSATLVMDMTDLYWGDSANIWTKPIGIGAVSLVASSLDYYGIVAVYSGDLYTTSGDNNQNNFINKIAISDGSVTTIITMSWYSRASIEVDASGVYWTDIPAGTISKAAHDGSSVVTLATGLNSPHSLILESGKLYWAEDNAIKSMSTSGGAITTIAENVSPEAMIKDLNHMYFVDSNEIVSANIATGEVTVLAVGQYDAYSMVVDDTSLYWLIGGSQYSLAYGKLRKCAKEY